MENKPLKEVVHHKQLKLCKTRPAYRQGRKLTAIKTYTINNESQHLFIYGVPQINLRTELKTLCRKYGELLSIHVTNEYKTEAFTECYHVHYERIQSARIAKRFLDNKSFYGGVLHVCYAPEYETVMETRMKLMQRCKDVLCRVGYGYYGKRSKPLDKKENKRGFNSFKRKFENVEVDPLDIVQEVQENMVQEENHLEESENSKKDSLERNNLIVGENNCFKESSKRLKSDLKNNSFIPMVVIRSSLENKSKCKKIVYRNNNKDLSS